MTTMIIANDETNVREGLKEVVCWEQLGVHKHVAYGELFKKYTGLYPQKYRGLLGN